MDIQIISYFFLTFFNEDISNALTICFIRCGILAIKKIASFVIEWSITFLKSSLIDGNLCIKLIGMCDSIDCVATPSKKEFFSVVSSTTTSQT